MAGKPRLGSSAYIKVDLLSRIEMIEVELDLVPGTLHPVEGLARIAGNLKTPLDIRVDCLKAIAPYCLPRLATVTVKGDEDNPIIIEHVNIDRFLMDPQLVAAAQRIALAMEEDEVKTIEASRDIADRELPEDRNLADRDLADRDLSDRLDPREGYGEVPR